MYMPRESRNLCLIQAAALCHALCTQNAAQATRAHGLPSQDPAPPDPQFIISGGGRHWQVGLSMAIQTRHTSGGVRSEPSARLQLSDQAIA